MAKEKDSVDGFFEAIGVLLWLLVVCIAGGSGLLLLVGLTILVWRLALGL